MLMLMLVLVFVNGGQFSHSLWYLKMRSFVVMISGRSLLRRSPLLDSLATLALIAYVLLCWRLEQMLRQS